VACISNATLVESMAGAGLSDGAVETEQASANSIVANRIKETWFDFFFVNMVTPYL
jgi:hypothetical protein